MRPEILFPLFKTVSSLAGVGTRTEKLFHKIGIHTVRDLILRPPTRFVDRQLKAKIQGIPPNTPLSVRGIVLEHIKPKTKTNPYVVKLKALDTIIELVFFRASIEWLHSKLPVGAIRIISGTLEIYNYTHRIVHPDHILTESDFQTLPKFETVYGVTAGLTNKFYRKTLDQALSLVPDLPEWIDPHLLEKRQWPSWKDSIHRLHNPRDIMALDANTPERERLAYDELMAHQLNLMQVRSEFKKQPKPPLMPTGDLQTQLQNHLPYSLTGAQKRSVEDIIADLQKPFSMLRLLQGDVGSGKTLVALFSMLAVIEGGGQCALMIPTEVLARQHGASIGKLCTNIVKKDGRPVTCHILTGRDQGTARTKIVNDIASGDVDIVIGTHALFQNNIAFKNLKFIVLDEQHRFGVQQRLALIEKGKSADILTMTATPIPRTLCLAQYGDMDLSVLDEKPAGRLPIETRLLSIERISDVVERLKAAFQNKAQAYWICPLVEETETLDLTAAQTRYESLSKALEGFATVGLVHGKQPAKEKEETLNAFHQGKIDLLVATTVIEVGIDVPNASIIIIEHAERFGLAQLHQLRGRVGRGATQSTCLLLYSPPLGKVSRERLVTMRDTNDGFKIAEKDFQMRGAGDIIGNQQSGLPDFHLVDWSAHLALMEIAHKNAKLYYQKPSTNQSDAVNILLSLFHRECVQTAIRSG